MQILESGQCRGLQLPTPTPLYLLPQKPRVVPRLLCGTRGFPHKVSYPCLFLSFRSNEARVLTRSQMQAGSFLPSSETRRTRCSKNFESSFYQVDNCLTLSSAECRRITITDRRNHHRRARAGT